MSSGRVFQSVGPAAYGLREPKGPMYQQPGQVRVCLSDTLQAHACTDPLVLGQSAAVCAIKLT